MSYILAIFAPPAGMEMPDSVHDVSELVDHLHQEPPLKDGAPYRLLVAALRAQLPHPSPDSWLHALADDDSGPVYNIAIDSGKIEVLAPLVVRCARRLGLAVFDTQAAQAFWPDGKQILFVPQRPQPPGPDSAHLSEFGPASLPAGTPYLLYCAGHQFTFNERATAERLPALLAGNGPPSFRADDRFVALEARLAARFGRSSADPASVWAVDLPKADSISQVYPLAVKAEHIAKVRPEIIAVAGNVWLALFDPQAAQVHHPNGEISARGEHWKSDPARPPSDAALVNAVAEVSAPLLQSNGFVPEGNGKFVRKFPHVEQEIAFFDPGHNAVALNVNLLVLHPFDAPKEANPNPRPEGFVLLGVWARLGAFVTQDYFRDPLFFTPRNMGEIEIRSVRDVLPVGREIARVLADRVLPCLDSTACIADLHSAFRSADHPLRPLSPSTRLILAKLAGDPGVRQAAAGELDALRHWKWNPNGPCLDKAAAQRELGYVEALSLWLESTA